MGPPGPCPTWNPGSLPWSRSPYMFSTPHPTPTAGTPDLRGLKYTPQSRAISAEPTAPQLGPGEGRVSASFTGKETYWNILSQASV